MAARKPAKKKAKGAQGQGKDSGSRSKKTGGVGSRTKTKKKAKKKSSRKSGKKHDPLDNIRPYQFRPGQSGNPGGMKKGTISLTRRLRNLLAMPVREEGCKTDPDYVYADQIVEIAVEAARRGKYPFFKEIVDRIDGKVPDHVVMEGTKRMVAQEAANLAQDLLGLIEEVATSMLADSIADMFMVTLGRKFEEAFAPKEEGLPEDIVILKTEEAEPPAVQTGELGA